MKVKLNDFMATVEVLDVKFSGTPSNDTLKTDERITNGDTKWLYLFQKLWYNKTVRGSKVWEYNA
ncbi:TPA: hypothetical protein ACLY9X_001917 [Streptococcus pneumoniae]